MIFLFALMTTLIHITIVVNLRMIKLNHRKIIALGACTFVGVSVALFISKPVCVPAATLIVTILYLNKINKEYIKNAIIAIVAQFILSISDIISGLVTIEILNMSKEQLWGNTWLYISLHIVVFIIGFIVSRILGYVLNKVKVLKKNSKFMKLLLANLFIGLFMIYIVANIYIFSKEDIIVLVLNLILLVAYFLLIAYVVINYVRVSNEQIKYEFKDKELKHLREYTEMIETSNEDIRKFKHDYLNILSTIDGYTENEDIKGLKDYLKNYITPMSMEINYKNMSYNNLINIKVPEVKGLLSYKIGQAQKLNINITVEILDVIENLKINMVDLSRILGIFLDNAIEETKNCDDKQIIICIVRKKHFTTAIIANTFREGIPPIYKMVEKGFSTKGQNRGLGLNTVQEIIYNEYNNITLNTYVDDKLFKQELVIED